MLRHSVHLEFDFDMSENEGTSSPVARRLEELKSSEQLLPELKSFFSLICIAV